jgi:hypothetical protein
MSRDLEAFYQSGIHLLANCAEEGSKAAGAEESLSVITRACMSTLGYRDLPVEEKSLREGEIDQYACGAFFVFPGGDKQILLSPQNYGPDQHYMVIGTDIGHPGWVVKNRQSLLLRNTDEHQSFVRILKTFRGGSVVYSPIEWNGRFLGQIICAAQARNVMDTPDLNLLVSLSGLAGALWVAHGGLDHIQVLAKKYGDV